MNAPVQQVEFNAAIARLSQQVIEGNETAHEILVEAKRTNGRVYALERSTSETQIRLQSLTDRVDKSDPLTKRDLYVGLGVLSAAAAAVNWLPRLLAMAGAK